MNGSNQLTNSADARPIAALATTAIAAVSLFPIIVIALNLIQRHNYSPSHQAISELALGSGGSLMVLAFSGLAVGIFLVAVIIRRTSAKARITPVLLALASIPAGPISAAFHTDHTGAGTTLHGTIHDTAGLIAFLLILLAMITAAFRFRHEPAWRPHALTTGVLAAVGTLTFFLIPALGNAHFGFSQRLFVTTFIAWLLITAGYAHRISTRRNPDQDESRPLPTTNASHK